MSYLELRGVSKTYGAAATAVQALVGVDLTWTKVPSLP